MGLEFNNFSIFTQPILTAVPEMITVCPRENAKPELVAVTETSTIASACMSMPALFN